MVKEPKKKQVIVYTAGTWDLFHEGHVNILRESKKHGDILIVGVNTDELIEEHKFKRPVYSFEERMAIIKGSKYVDKAVKQEIMDDPKMMKELKVDILTVGSDWEKRYDVPGLNWMRENRKVVYLPYTKGVSTTEIKERIKNPEKEQEYIKNGFLVGKKIYLRPIQKEDIEIWYTWFNNPAVTQYLKHGVFPNTYEKQEEYFERISKLSNIIQLAIADKLTNKLVGMVSIREIDWIRRTGGIGIVIGKKEDRNRGIGLESMALMIFHAFTKMNLNRLWTEQHEGLKRVSNAWRRHLCFQTEGIERDAVFTDGEYHNYTLMSVLAKDFLKKLKEKGLDGILDEF